MGAVTYRQSVLSLLGLLASGTFMATAGAFAGLYLTEGDLQHSHSRNNGFFRALESVIGMTGIHILFFVFAVAGFWLSLIMLWKLVDRRPDAVASEYGIEFHPAILSGAVPYSEIVKWCYRTSSQRKFLQFGLQHSRWSLSGIWPRKSVNLMASGNGLDELADYLAGLPAMAKKRKQAI